MKTQELAKKNKNNQNYQKQPKCTNNHPQVPKTTEIYQEPLICTKNYLQVASYRPPEQKILDI